MNRWKMEYEEKIMASNKTMGIKKFAYMYYIKI